MEISLRHSRLSQKENKLANQNDYGINYVSTFASGTSFFQLANGTALIKSGPAKLVGLFCSTAGSTPTIAFMDALNGSSGGTVIPVFTPVSATMYNFGANLSFGTGLYVTATGSVTFMVFYY